MADVALEWFPLNLRRPWEPSLRTSVLTGIKDVSKLKITTESGKRPCVFCFKHLASSLEHYWGEDKSGEDEMCITIRRRAGALGVLPRRPVEESSTQSQISPLSLRPTPGDLSQGGTWSETTHSVISKLREGDELLPSQIGGSLFFLRSSAAFNAHDDLPHPVEFESKKARFLDAVWRDLDFANRRGTGHFELSESELVRSWRAA